MPALLPAALRAPPEAGAFLCLAAVPPAPDLGVIDLEGPPLLRLAPPPTEVELAAGRGIFIQNVFHNK